MIYSCPVHEITVILNLEGKGDPGAAERPAGNPRGIPFPVDMPSDDKVPPGLGSTHGMRNGPATVSLS